MPGYDDYQHAKRPLLRAHTHTHTPYGKKLVEISLFRDFEISSPLGGQTDGQTHRGVTSFNNIDSRYRPAA